MSSRLRSRVPASNVPIYTIDLSLPPRARYKQLTKEYHTQIQDIVPLFNSLLTDLGVTDAFHLTINRLARVFLRGVKSKVETAELQGIAETASVPMYLLVAFNVVLDLLMGCTSGAVRTTNRAGDDQRSRLLHFRTLDWSMDPLRKIIVQLDFVRTKSAEPTKIVASSITYAGFVGVLTGVRQGLSISLNFRPLHNAATKSDQLRFYLHHLLVLLGVRPSISSLLRAYFISEYPDNVLKSLDEIANEVTPRHTTAAYLTCCDGQRAISMEKDYSTAVVRESTSFIAATNHDLDKNVTRPNAQTPAAKSAPSRAPVAALQELLDESRDRLGCVEKKWNNEVRRVRKRSTKRVRPQHAMEDDSVSISEAEAVKWVSDWPTTNEMTHFAAVLDPEQGRVLWSHAYATSLREPEA